MSYDCSDGLALAENAVSFFLIEPITYTVLVSSSRVQQFRNYANFAKKLTFAVGLLVFTGHN
jgi:hypothetical protein